MNKDSVKIEELIFEKYIGQQNIESRIKELANQISKDYIDKDPVILIILKGAFMFASDLVKALKIDAPIAFVKVSSYQGTESTGQIKLIMDADIDIENRHIIIIEDIVDTGTTLNHYMNSPRLLKTRSIAIASLLVKPNKLQYDIKVAYPGFKIEDDFVIGYGLDYNEYGRLYPDIYQLAKEV